MLVSLRIVPHVAAVAALSIAASCAVAQTPPPSTSSPTPVASADAHPMADAAVSATDQPNDSADLKIAAAVRRSITDDHSLSTRAHNITLIAKAGEVTLRGPVKTDDEKARIEQLARSTPGVSEVHNELDVSK